MTIKVYHWLHILKEDELVLCEAIVAPVSQHFVITVKGFHMILEDEIDSLLIRQGDDLRSLICFFDATGDPFIIWPIY